MEDRYLYNAKRADNGQWVQGNLVYSEDSEDGWETLIIPTRDSNMFTEGSSKGNLGFENWYRVYQDTICQCTGLKDKNENLIWENDIIKDNVIYGVVRWDEVNARYIVDDREDGYQDYSEWWHECEVIGNIFDNPDLLESEG